MKLTNKNKIGSLLLAALGLRLILSFFGTLELDFNTFVAWSNMLVENGFKAFYSGWSDYLPGYLYVLILLGKISQLNFLPNVILYKLPAIVADLGIGYLIYKIALQLKLKNKKALILSSFWLFNPAVLANSTLWGQVDSLTAFFSLLSVYLFPFSLSMSSISLAIGAMVKPQAAVTALVIIYLFIKNKTDYKNVAIYILLAGVVFAAGFIPFWTSGSLPEFIISRLSATMEQYKYTSVNALNIWGLSGFWQPDTLVNQSVGYLLFIAVSAWSFLRLKGKKAGEYAFLAVVFLANFLFFTRLHERHLLPALAPILAISAFNTSFLIPYALLSLTYIANLYYSYVWITQDFREVLTPFFRTVLIFANLVSLAYILNLVKNLKSKLTFNMKFGKVNLDFAGKKEIKVKDFIGKKKAVSIVLLIILFSLVVRLVSLSNPPEEYFDEVYHAFTARQMLEKNPMAWEWWNPHPEGFAYEWTHPPVAKEAMWLGMTVMGKNALGWRLPAVLFGTISVFLVYMLALKLFANRSVGVFSAAFYSLEGLPLVMSRIGMNDIYMLTFVLASLYLYLEKKHFFAALLFGLAVASKWSAVWAVPIFVFHHFLFKEKLTRSHVWYFVLPVLVYIASYIPMFTSGHGLDIFIGVQKQMWWYHTRLDATHPFTSPWWSWPILARPVWVYSGESIGKTISNIYIMGNPIVFWSGLVAVFYSIYLIYQNSISGKVNKTLLLVVFSYLVFFVPWAASPRIMFLYHYLPSIPFLAIALGFVVTKYKKLQVPLLVLSFIVFIYFLPRYTGIRVPVELDSSYHIFNGW